MIWPSATRHATCPKRMGRVCVHCKTYGCGHNSPMALAPLVIRWGADAPLERLLRSARCMACQKRGAEIRHPSWRDSEVGFQPFPAERYPAPFNPDPFRAQRKGTSSSTPNPRRKYGMTTSTT